MLNPYKIDPKWIKWFIGLADAEMGINKTSKKLVGTTVGLPKITQRVRNMMELSPYQYSVVIGLLLSDGWLSLSTTKNPNKSRVNARLGFKQSLQRFNYLWSVFYILSPYCSNYPYLIINKRAGHLNYGVQFFTLTLPCFTKLHKLFYINETGRNGVKMIPLDIYNLLDPIALAHWIMGDGQFVKTGGLTICTDSYSIIDVVRLMNVLMIVMISNVLYIVIEKLSIGYISLKDLWQN
jgi:hypothetical protein